MKIPKKDLAWLLLPVVLWPIVFIGLSGVFVYAMLCAAVLLAAFTLLKYKKFIKFKEKSENYGNIILIGLIGSIVLYLVFLCGYRGTVFLGLSGYVSSIYTMLYSQGSAILVAPILAIIGVAEEIYWRGGIQGYIRKNSKFFAGKAWLGSSIYYAAVHLLTLNPILAGSAFFVGAITGMVAEKYGIVASAIVHVIWLEAVVIFIPVNLVTLQW